MWKVVHKSRTWSKFNVEALDARLQAIERLIVVDPRNLFHKSKGDCAFSANLDLYLLIVSTPNSSLIACSRARTAGVSGA